MENLDLVDMNNPASFVSQRGVRRNSMEAMTPLNMNGDNIVTRRRHTGQNSREETTSAAINREHREDETAFVEIGNGVLLRQPSYEQDTNRDFTGVSFIHSADRSKKNEFIKEYRNGVMSRMDGVLAGIQKEFSDKLNKNENHRQILKTGRELASAMEALRLAERAPARTSRTPKKNVKAEKLFEAKQIDKLKQALTNMEEAAINYIDNSNDPVRTELTKDIVNYIHQLRVTDSKLNAANMSNAHETIEFATDRIYAVNPEAAKEFTQYVDGLLYNASPESVVQSSLDNVKMILDNFLPEIPEAGALAGGLGQTSLGLGIVGDVMKAINLIRDMRGGTTAKATVLDAAGLGVNVTKNISAATQTVADKLLGQTAAQVSQTAGHITAGASTALGAGYAAHGGLLVYKTQTRVRNIGNLGDEVSFKNQIMDRAKTKRRRALMEAVGGTVAVVGGVVAIVGTAGAAAPVIAGIGAVIGGSLAMERMGRSLKKGQQRGEERQELADTIHQSMRQLIAEGSYNKALEISRALTNNQAKQYLIVKGAEESATSDEQTAGRNILREKLKTW